MCGKVLGGYICAAWQGWENWIGEGWGGCGEVGMGCGMGAVWSNNRGVPIKVVNLGNCGSQCDELGVELVSSSKFILKAWSPV